MDGAHAYYRVTRDEAIVDTFLTGSDSSEERDQARELALACAKRALRRGSHVEVSFACALTSGDETTWLTCAVWDSVKDHASAESRPYHRQRLSPLAERVAV